MSTFSNSSEQKFEFSSDLEKQEWVRLQKAKAQVLRKSQWWRQQVGPGVCTYCGQKVGASQLTMDHRIPVSRGGVSSRSNCVPACKTCNNQKKNKILVEVTLC